MQQHIYSYSNNIYKKLKFSIILFYLILLCSTACCNETDEGEITDRALLDSDHDGLTDEREEWWFCDPNNEDTNGDGFKDGESLDIHKIPPFLENSIGIYDHDRDNLPSLAEIYDTKTDPKVFSTDGDPYGDGEEFFGINMPCIMSPADGPFVAAYPDLRVQLVGISVTPIEEKTSIEGRLEQNERSYNTEKSFIKRNTDELGVGVEIEAGISPLKLAAIGANAYYAHVWEDTQSTTVSVTDSGLSQYERSTATTTNTNKAAELDLILNVENIGTAPAEDITPYINIKLGATEIESVKLPNPIRSLDIGEKSSNFVVSGGTISQDQLLYIDCGAPIDIETWQVDSRIKKWDSEQRQWELMDQDYSAYRNEINRRTATIILIIDEKNYKKYKVYAGPSTTLGDAINWTIEQDANVQKQTGGKLYLGFSPKEAFDEVKNLADNNDSISSLKLKPGWEISIKVYTDFQKPVIHWAGYGGDMRSVNASVRSDFGIKNVVAHVKIEDKYQDIEMKDIDGDTIYSMTTTQKMERDEDTYILATDIENSTAQLRIAIPPPIAPFEDGRYIFSIKSHGGDIFENLCNDSMIYRCNLTQIDNGYYIIRDENDQELFLEVVGGEQAEDANASRQGAYSGYHHQQWYFEPVEDDYYKICSKYNEKCLTVFNGTVDSTESVTQSTYQSQDNQKWLVETVEDISSSTIKSNFSEPEEFYHINYNAYFSSYDYGGSGKGRSNSRIMNNSIKLYCEDNFPYGNHWASGTIGDEFIYDKPTHYNRIILNTKITGTMQLIEISVSDLLISPLKAFDPLDNFVDLNVYMVLHDKTLGRYVDSKMVYSNKLNKASIVKIDETVTSCMYSQLIENHIYQVILKVGAESSTLGLSRAKIDFFDSDKSDFGISFIYDEVEWFNNLE